MFVFKVKYKWTNGYRTFWERSTKNCLCKIGQIGNHLKELFLLINYRPTYQLSTAFQSSMLSNILLLKLISHYCHQCFQILCFIQYKNQASCIAFHIKTCNQFKITNFCRHFIFYFLNLFPIVLLLRYMYMMSNLKILTRSLQNDL